jgi:YidC/Oxa1 family membrane protein insertase
MKKLLKNKRLWLIVTTLLVLVLISGCTRLTDSSGKVLTEKIITIATSFQTMMSKEGWFEALFVWPLAQVINNLTPVIGVTLAIVTATIIVNVITFGVSVKATVGTQKMQVLQPELVKIQEKYKGRNDDQSKMAMSKEMQDLYSKHGVNPFGSIFVTFLQFPIIIAMWQAVQRAEAVATGTLMGASLSVSPLDGFKSGNWLFVAIFLAMGLAQFAAMKLPQYLAKKKLARDRKLPRNPNEKLPPDQTSQITMFMLIFIMFIAISWPTAMSLYWFVSSLAMIIKTLFIQWRYIDNEKV